MTDFIRITFSTAEQSAQMLRQDAGILEGVLNQLQRAASNLYASGLQGAFLDDLQWRIQNAQDALRQLRDEHDEAGRDLATVTQWLRQMDSDSAAAFGTFSRLDILHGFPGGGGGGGGSGGWGMEASGFNMKSFPRHMMSGIEQLIPFLPFANQSSDYANATNTLLNEEHAVELVVWQGQLSADNAAPELSLFKTESIESYSVELDENSLNAEASYEIGAYLMKVEANANVAGASLSAEGYVGANAETKVGAVFDPISGDAKLETSLDYFVGGRAEAEVETNLSAIGVDSVDLGLQGAVSYGLGAKFNADIGVENGVFVADVDIGATLGLGAEFGFTIEVDANKAGQDIAEFGQSVFNFADSLLRN